MVASSKKNNIILGTIGLVIAFLFLFWQNTAESIAGDEAYSIFNALTGFDDIVQLSMKDQNPPLFLFLLKIWTFFFGIETFAVRAFSALISTACLGVLFQLANRIFNKPTAIIAVVLLILSHSFIYFAQEVRCYALVLLLSIVSTNFVEKYWQTNQKKYLIYYGFVTILLIFSHYLSAFFIVTQALAILISGNFQKIKGFLTTWLSVGVLLTPWAIFILNNMPKRGEFWLTSPSPDDFYYEWTHMFDSKILAIAFFAVLIAILVLYILKVPSFRNIFKSKKGELNWGLYFVLIAILPSILEFFVAQFTPIFIMRYYFYSLVGVVVIFSLLLYALYQSKKIVSGIVSLFLLACFVAAFDISPQKAEDWRGAVKAIKEKNFSDYQIIASPAYKTKEIYYYLNRDYFKNVKTFKESDSANEVYGVTTSDQLRNIPYLKNTIVVFLEIGDANHSNNNFLLDFLKSKGYVVEETINFPGYRNSVIIFKNYQNTLSMPI